MRYQVTVAGRTFEIEVTQDGQVWVDRQPLSVDLKSIDGLPQHSLLVDHRSFETHVESDTDGECQVVVRGRPYQAQLHREQDQLAGQSAQPRQDGPAAVIAPLPGLLLELRVKQGQLVREGDVIAVLDTMKMHLELRAPTSGAIIEACGSPMTEVLQGDVLAVIHPVARAASSPGTDTEG